MNEEPRREEPEAAEPATGPSPEESEPSGFQMVLGCLGAILLLLVPVALYLGLVTWMGLRPHPDVGLPHYAGGAVLALVTMGVVSIMGESLIEDLVKFVLLGGAAFAIARGQAPATGAVLLGAAVGTFMPLLTRVLLVLGSQVGLLNREDV